MVGDPAYFNAKSNSNEREAGIEHDTEAARLMTERLNDDTELFKQFSDNEGVKCWLTDTTFGLAHEAHAS